MGCGALHHHTITCVHVASSNRKLRYSMEAGYRLCSDFLAIQLVSHIFKQFIKQPLGFIDICGLLDVASSKSMQHGKVYHTTTHIEMYRIWWPFMNAYLWQKKNCSSTVSTKTGRSVIALSLKLCESSGKIDSRALRLAIRLLLLAVVTAAIAPVFPGRFFLGLFLSVQRSLPRRCFAQRRK